jgi:hypothetical protein
MGKAGCAAGKGEAVWTVVRKGKWFVSVWGKGGVWIR